MIEKCLEKKESLLKGQKERKKERNGDEAPRQVGGGSGKHVWSYHPISYVYPHTHLHIVFVSLSFVDNGLYLYLEISRMIENWRETFTIFIL